MQTSPVVMKCLTLAVVTVIAAFFVWFYVVEGYGSERAGPLTRIEIMRSDGTKVALNVEVAVTPEQKTRGLMFRNSLGPTSGMVFIWDEDQPVSMWMKNTYISLDMLYVRRDGTIVKILTNAEPRNLTPLPSGEIVHGVIEINGGDADRLNIKTGDKVLFRAFSDAPAALK